MTAQQGDHIFGTIFLQTVIVTNALHNIRIDLHFYVVTIYMCSLYMCLIEQGH